MTINFEEDTPVVSADDLKNIAQLARQVVEGESEVADLEERLKAAKNRLKAVQEGALPEAMKAVGMTEFKTINGHSISVTETLYASIAAKNKAKAAQWLVNNNLAALVKEDLVVSFDKGQHDDVIALVDSLQKMGEYNISTSENINTGSVKSAIKELLEEGVDVPLELFGAYFLRKAVVL